MEFPTKVIDNVAVIELLEELSEAKRDDLESLREHCRTMQENGNHDIVFNMKQMGTAPSMVLGTLIVIQKRLKTAEGHVAMSEISETLQKIFTITGIDRLIKTYDNEDAAIKALEAGEL